MLVLHTIQPTIQKYTFDRILLGRRSCSRCPSKFILRLRSDECKKKFSQFAKITSMILSMWVERFRSIYFYDCILDFDEFTSPKRYFGEMKKKVDKNVFCIQIMVVSSNKPMSRKHQKAHMNDLNRRRIFFIQLSFYRPRTIRGSYKEWRKKCIKQKYSS